MRREEEKRGKERRREGEERRGERSMYSGHAMRATVE